MAEIPTRWRGQRFVAVTESVISDNHIRMESKRAIRLRKGDVVLRMSRDGGDVIFHRAQEIDKAELTPPNPEREMDRYLFEATLSDEHQISLDNLSLREFAFSLTKVMKTDNPSAHFRRSYTYVPTFDAEVLAGGEIFWARTAVGMLGMALPESARLAVLASVIQEDPEAAHDLDRAWRLFRQVVDGEYLRPAYILTKTVENLSSTLGVEAAGRLTIVDPDENGRPLALTVRAPQAREALDKFRYDEESGESELLREVDQTVQESRNRDMERFGESFKGRRWPIGIFT